MSDLYKDSLPGGVAFQKTVGTSAVAIYPHSQSLLTGVIIKAIAANTGIVYVGFCDDVASTTGYELSAGDSVPISVDDLAKIFAIADAASQTICVMGQ